jgi:hypothetical protein
MFHEILKLQDMGVGTRQFLYVISMSIFCPRVAIYDPNTIKVLEHAVAQSVEALRYKPECRRFDSR